MHWKINANIVVAQEDGELVLLHMETGKFYGLDLVGTKIWNLLQAPMEIEQIVSALEQEFQVSPDVLRQDVTRFLESMAKQKLVERV